MLKVKVYRFVFGFMVFMNVNYAYSQTNGEVDILELLYDFYELDFCSLRTKYVSNKGVSDSWTLEKTISLEKEKDREVMIITTKEDTFSKITLLNKYVSSVKEEFEDFYGDKGGIERDYLYDSLNRIIEIKVQSIGVSETQHVTDYHYLGDSLIKIMTVVEECGCSLDTSVIFIVEKFRTDTLEKSYFNGIKSYEDNSPYLIEQFSKHGCQILNSFYSNEWGTLKANFFYEDGILVSIRTILNQESQRKFAYEFEYSNDNKDVKVVCLEEKGEIFGEYEIIHDQNTANFIYWQKGKYNDQKVKIICEF